MIEQEKIAEWIDRYNNHDLSDTENHQFSLLLSKHPVLKAEVKVDQELNVVIGDEDTMILIQKLEKIRKSMQKTNSRHTHFLLAASFLILLASGILVFLFFCKPKDFLIPTTVQEGQESNATKGLRETIPCLDPGATFTINPVEKQRKTERMKNMIARYEKLPELELFIGVTTRAGMIQLSSPIARLQISSGSIVLFEWKYLYPIYDLSLQVLDNHGKELTSISPLMGDQYSLETSSFGKGRIYWKMIMKDEIVAMGSIILM